MSKLVRLSLTAGLCCLAVVVMLMTACGSAPKSSAEPHVDSVAVVEPVVEELPVGDASHPEYIVISKEEMHLSLYDRDSLLICRFGVAVGKHYGNKQRPGDMKTPEGSFTISQIQDASTWCHDFNDGNGVIEGCYGNWFMRLSTPPHTGIGIHGTHAPESIGERATEGCIRLNNNDLDSLKQMVRVGMRVDILSSRMDREADGIVEEMEPEVEPSLPAAPETATPEVTTPEASRPVETLTTTESAPVEECSEELWYTVVDGDLVGSIARRYDTSTTRIVELNPGLNPDRISIGDRIRVR